jgi:hypothetical protein
MFLGWKECMDIRTECTPNFGLMLKRKAQVCRFILLSNTHGAHFFVQPTPPGQSWLLRIRRFE